MGKKERAQQRREQRRLEITLLRTLPYTDHQRTDYLGQMYPEWGLDFNQANSRVKTFSRNNVVYVIYANRIPPIWGSGFRWWTSNTIALVTGANRGIGFEIARQLASHGFTVIVTSRDTSVGEEAVKVLQEGGLKVVVHQLDIADPSSIQALAKWTKDIYGGVDILVNNAGVNFNVGSDNSVEFAEKVISTNYFGTKNMIKAMIPVMRPSESGARIVNVSSRLGRLNGRRNRIGNIDLRKKLENDESLSEDLIDQTMNAFLEQVKDDTWRDGGWPQVYTDYSLSKLAVNAYTRLMTRIHSNRPDDQKIYINCCCPGWVKTAMTSWAGHTSPEEGADTAVWLALLSDRSITGKFFAERREINF